MSYVRSVHEPSLVSKNKSRSWTHRSSQEQTRPYDKPLPMSVQGSRLSSYSKMGTAYKGGTLVPNLPYTFGRLNTRDPKMFTKAHNKALGKVSDQLRVASSFWEDWYERQQSIALITKSTKALINFAKNWKSPRYWKHLAKDRRPSDLPSAWLSYQFGIKPLVGGIDRAVNLLSKDFPVMKISGSSGDSLSRTITSPHDTSWGSSIGFAEYDIRCKIGCRVVGINPNRALSGASGLGEPFSSAWSVLPWGWAVDYFLNVGELLSNLENNHPGIKVTDWYVTNSVRVELYSRTDWEKSGLIAGERWSFVSNTSHFDIVRTTSQSMPKFLLEFKYPRLGGNQAANLMSALALTMKGKK